MTGEVAPQTRRLHQLLWLQGSSSPAQTVREASHRQRWFRTKSCWLAAGVATQMQHRSCQRRLLHRDSLLCHSLRVPCSDTVPLLPLSCLQCVRR